jgi:hypothetical protein
LTTPPQPVHNGRVFGRLILAVLFCLSALAAADRTIAAAPGHDETTIDVASYEPDAPGTGAPNERQWNAGSSREASITGSIWRSQAHHAELAGASHSHGVVISTREDIAAPSRPRPPRHAQNLPLLI